MEHKRDKIIKSLECCRTNSEMDCTDCHYRNKSNDLYDGCVNTLLVDALSLIKELTQSNEMLSESYDHLEKTKDELIAERARLTEENERLREDKEWISVEDRLPEQEGWYLVYTMPDKKHKSINKAEFIKDFEWNNFEPYWRGAGGHWGNVAYWMSLPTPPKRKENNNEPCM